MSKLRLEELEDHPFECYDDCESCQDYECEMRKYVDEENDDDESYEE